MLHLHRLENQQRRTGVNLGGDNEYVVRQIVGRSAAAYRQLADAGVLEMLE